jgi:short-subunit dehydrogenase
MAPNFDERPRVAVVTGAARGIGRATAASLKRAGWAVAICDVDAETMAATVAGLSIDHAQCVDLGQVDELDPFIAGVESALGPIDLLVNNAGIMPAGPFLEEPESVTGRMLAINLLAVIALTRRVLPGMVARGRGHIINVASMAGDIPVPGTATYCGAKAGVVNFTDAVRLEHRNSGVRFTTVHPATVATDLAAGIGAVRGSKVITAEAVAVAIAKAARQPRDRVYVPAMLGRAIRLQGLLPASVAAALGHLIGADTVALRFDPVRRRDYAERIGQRQEKPQRPAASTMRPSEPRV